MIHKFVTQPYIKIENTQVTVEAYVSNEFEDTECETLKEVKADLIDDDDIVGISIKFNLSNLLNDLIDSYSSKEGRLSLESKPSFDLIKLKLQKLIKKIDAIEYQEELP